VGISHRDFFKNYNPEVFKSAAEKCNWTPFDRGPGHLPEWTFFVSVMGDPVEVHVTQRDSGFPKVHGPVYDHPVEFKVACRMVLSALDKAEYALYGGRKAPNWLVPSVAGRLKRARKWRSVTNDRTSEGATNDSK